MNVNDFAAPAGSSFKFDTLGATLEGTITYVGEWRTQTNKFTGATEQSCRIGVDPGAGETVYIYVKKDSAMARAIGDALRAASLSDLLEGQRLKLQHHETKDTGKGLPAKLYRAKVVGS